MSQSARSVHAMLATFRIHGRHQRSYGAVAHSGRPVTAAPLFLTPKTNPDTKIRELNWRVRTNEHILSLLRQFV